MSHRISWSNARRLTAAALVLAAAAALSSCGSITPHLSKPLYAASDGVQASLGDVASGENLLILTSGAGDVGVLTGALTNLSGEPISITIALKGETSDITTQRLNARQTLLLGPGDNAKQIPIPKVPAAPGAVQYVTISTPDYGSVEVPVPVLDGTFPEYATEVPTPTASTAAAG